VLTVTDNPFCTSCLARPLEQGIDLVMHSMTKYLGGRGDATGGIVAEIIRNATPRRSI
jgi:methionine-gamma-lyase